MGYYRVNLKSNEVSIVPYNDSLNGFIQKLHGNKKFLTRKKYAEVLAKFLGETKVESLTAEYINSYFAKRATTVSRSTFELERNIITAFLNYIGFDMGEIVEIPTRQINVINSISCIEPEYVSLLLATCNKHEPRINLLVVLSLIGGLRASECINLTKASVTEENGQLFIEIADRKLRENHQGHAHVRTARKVSVNFGEHIEIYRRHLNEFTNPENPALFIDSYDQPMTYQTVYKRFSVVKKHFIENLLDSGDPQKIAYGFYLKDRDWGLQTLRNTCFRVRNTH